MKNRQNHLTKGCLPSIIKSKKIEYVRPKKIKSNVGNWKTPLPLEFYVDYETVTDIVSDFTEMPYSEYENMIYLVGVGWESQHNNAVEKKGWNFRYFVVNRLNSAEERRILTEWKIFMDNLANVHYQTTDYKIFHYGHHERSSFDAALEKHHFNWDITEWFDVHKEIILKEPVVVFGALTFGLKEISNALYKNELIKTKWPNDSVCKDGLDALILAKECHDDAIKKKVSMKVLPIMKDIIRYNEVDCKVLWEIITYLRNNHC